MQLTLNAKVIVLLTARNLQSDKGKAVKELSNSEWSRFAIWLKTRGSEPSVLLEDDVAGTLRGWKDEAVSLKRIKSLVERRRKLETALEEWEQAGIWIVTRADEEYPRQLKNKLKSVAPPVIYGCGNKNLLHSKMISMVGTQKTNEKDLKFVETLGGEVARQGLTVVTSDSRGVNERAIFGALSNDGRAIVVASDKILRKVNLKPYREYLHSYEFALISTASPEVERHVGNAKFRNQCIYCLSDLAIVVNCMPNRGEPWIGVIENMMHGWVPVWMQKTSYKYSGNHWLEFRGAQWLPDDLVHWLQIEKNRIDVTATYKNSRSSHESNNSTLPEVRNTQLVKNAKGDSTLTVNSYDMLLEALKSIASNRPVSEQDIATQLGLTEFQLKYWLKKAVESKVLKKFSNPVRYKYLGNSSQEEIDF